MSKLGVIDFGDVDAVYNKKTKKAINWVRSVRKYGHKWKTDPPSRKELYPNMCYDSGKWQKHKKEIADKIGEISNVWYCGVKNRDIALQNGIKSWKDEKCSCENIGIRGKKASVIDKILNINRQNRDKILPKKIKDNLFGWKDRENEMFIDFETIGDVFSSFLELPNQIPSDIVFMIGVYWKDKNSRWEYKNFICNKLTYEEEYRIMDEFNTFYTENGSPKLWFWHAEPRIWSRAEKRQFDLACEIGDPTLREIKKDHISDNWKVVNWYDMCQLFKKTPIVIKNCFKFGLKQVAKAMREHKLIKTEIDSECASGMTAMVNAWKCYQKHKSNTKSVSKSPVMLDVAKYNEFDCKVLHEILEYLRKNHV